MRCVGGLSACCKLVQDNLLLPEMHRSVIHRLWHYYQRDQNASRRRGSSRRRITNGRRQLPVAMSQTPEDINSWRRSSLLLQEDPYPAKLCRADCMKADCLQDDLLFVGFCPQRTSERGCIGPVNIAVGHQSSGTTYSLRISLDLTSRRAMIWREPGTRYRAPNMVEKDYY
ncbi:hypothetical protein AVEN_202328-1 [Araneus ventricosus]|uniref:Uncharacterized protein n=1 Tax=Araneus ventricosus TaxID=182803 RepID=A0A4Y2E5B7_ARAVE|nr:hypothetical protein AVEN_202328-1 [Araneus ventricosus]